MDSVQRIRQQRIDSTRSIRKRYTDSLMSIRKRTMDSTFAARKAISEANRIRLKQRSDSLARIRKYRESKRYTDSVTRVRNRRIDSMRSARQTVIDSARNARKKILDSTLAIRKKYIDSSRAIMKRRSDSLTAIRKYRESKRFRDSVQVVRQSRLDSIKAVRKIFMDSITAVRKKTMDSLTKIRKARMDSLTAVRKTRTDSLTKIRAARADSLLKKKELRDKELKAAQKRKEDKMKMAFELKIKKKQEAWSNEKMLKKKWRFPRRSFQNMFTRYNYYYNANRKMEEAIRNMQRRKKDDFEQRITLFPFDPNKDSTVFAADMDTIIRKASIGIQIHDPRTKWADDLYLLMGQSYYYKGNYKMAESVFKYVVGMKNTNIYKDVKKKPKAASKDGSPLEKEKNGLLRFLRHRSVHNDGVLWLTRTYTDSKRSSEAEAILDLLDASSGVSERMKGKIALERAHLYIQQGATRAAGDELAQVMRSKAIDPYTRQRASFLNGQLQSELGMHDSAVVAFRKNIALHPAIDMDFYARKLMANSISEAGGDATQSMMALKRLLKDGKYIPYYEQVYFILGRLAANSGKDDEAIENFTLSLRQPKTTKKQKAISFASIGNIRYRRGEYTKAQRAYDSAAYFAKGVEENPEVSLAIRRAKSLDKIKEPSTTLQYTDSLLQLSKLSEKEQRANAKRYLKYLEKLKEDSIASAANPTADALAGAASGMPGSGAASWYFSNTTMIQQGFNEFKRKWGNRVLADNWRRGSTLSGGSTAAGGADTDTGSESNEVAAALTEESLIAFIPKKESEIAAAQKKIRLAYLALAGAYINDVEEYKEGLKSLDSLDARFPAHEYPDQVLSLRYKAYLRMNRLEEAEKFRTDLLEKYPESEFAKTLGGQKETDTAQVLRESVATYFESTYQSLMDREYTTVLSKTAKAQRTFGDPLYARKFRIMEAMAYVGVQQYKTADSLIEKYMKEYPADSLRPWADAIVRVIKEQRAADTLGDSAKVIIPKALADSAFSKVTAPPIPASYTFKAKSIHYVVFLFGKPDAKTAGFRSGISDYSLLKNGKVLDASQQMLNADQCMVVCKSFPDAKSANNFRSNALKEPLLFRELPKDTYISFAISEENFRKLVADKKSTEYLNFYRSKY